MGAGGSTGAAAVAALAALGLTGCASKWTTIAPEVRTDAERLGPAKGTATGTLCGLGHWTAHQFIPIAWGGRQDRAYDEAVASVPGATAITDVTLHETYYWFVFGWARKLTLTGQGVRP